MLNELESPWRLSPGVFPLPWFELMPTCSVFIALIIYFVGAVLRTGLCTIMIADTVASRPVQPNHYQNSQLNGIALNCKSRRACQFYSFHCQWQDLRRHSASSDSHRRHTLQIDLKTGTVEGTFQTDGNRPAYFPGIGGSPAIVDGKVYFSAIPGRVYCVDADTLSLIWVTDLRDADLSHNQPVQNDTADCWSSPLVVNGKVYVGCGEGESDAFGFVYCLNAHNGHVKLLFCTNKFSAAY